MHIANNETPYITITNLKEKLIKKYLWVLTCFFLKSSSSYYHNNIMVFVDMIDLIQESTLNNKKQVLNEH